jgi:hypothetical protein
MMDRHNRWMASNAKKFNDWAIPHRAKQYLQLLMWLEDNHPDILVGWKNEYERKMRE